MGKKENNTDVQALYNGVDRNTGKKDILSSDIIYNLHKYTTYKLPEFTFNDERYDLYSKKIFGDSTLLGYILISEDKDRYYASNISWNRIQRPR